MPPLPPSPAPIAVGDLATRRIIALSRVAAALLVAALGSVEFLALPNWVAWVAGLVWLPWASLIWFLEEGPPSSRRLLAGLVSDLIAISALMALFPSRADVVLVFSVPYVAVLAYHRGSRLGLVFGAALVVSRWTVAALVGEMPIDATLDVAATVSLVAVVVLLNRALTVQRRDARSVTQLAKRSDLILARSTEGLVVTGMDGTIRQVNPAAEQLFDTRRGASLVGQSCSHRLDLHTEYGPLGCRDSCALAALCADGGAVEVFNVVADRRQPLLASVASIPAPDGGTEMVHSFRDITRLRQADEAKSMFLATTSHELKTPITVIRGFAQVLGQTVTDPQAKVALDAITNRSTELAEIVDRLLLSSRIEAGRIDLEVTEVDLSEMLAKRLPTAIRTLGRTVTTHIPPGLVVLADANALSSGLDHLLDNAAKYSPGGAPIHVEAGSQGDHVVISVTDQGIGMTQEQAARCFDRFWQAEASDVRRFGGTGIGLYIVASLIRGMGGTIHVESTLGEGSTFTVRLRTVSAVADVSEAGPDPKDRTSVDEFMHHLGLPTGGS